MKKPLPVLILAVLCIPPVKHVHPGTETIVDYFNMLAPVRRFLAILSSTAVGVVAVLFLVLFAGCERNELYDLAKNSASGGGIKIGSIYISGDSVAGGGPSEFYWHKCTSSGDDLGVISGPDAGMTNFNSAINFTITITDPISPGDYFLITWGTGSTSAGLNRVYTFYDTTGAEITTQSHYLSSAALICREDDFTSTGDTFTLFYFDGTTVTLNQYVLP